ncbi:hypothetical protein BJ095_13227 [Ureibacillus chungkukjangi]|uniref:Uncharacterized protein n=1 Tax=Ureibacillus chungkukjangi TaxID=1202712 RepID=A0A318TF60_9BACL|nr:hypothetical protein BJ095_13227 [Ureibacillus chungkukjangi]
MVAFPSAEPRLEGCTPSHPLNADRTSALTPAHRTPTELVHSPPQLQRVHHPQKSHPAAQTLINTSTPQRAIKHSNLSKLSNSTQPPSFPSPHYPNSSLYPPRHHHTVRPRVYPVRTKLAPMIRLGWRS